MTHYTGPPDDAARTASPSRPGSCVKGPTTTHTRQVKRSAASPHIGRYASGWRAGFMAGAADALRQAGRRLPVETWHVVEELADAYALAADD
jgi:hypothetical protein